MSEDASTDQDLRRRIGLACGAMQNLSCIWNSNDISNNTKTRVYETLVLSILLYNFWKRGCLEKQTRVN